MCLTLRWVSRQCLTIPQAIRVEGNFYVHGYGVSAERCGHSRERGTMKQLFELLRDDAVLVYFFLIGFLAALMALVEIVAIIVLHHTVWPLT